MNKYKLSKIAKIYNGSTPSTKETDNYDGDIIWVTPKDLSDQNCKYFYKGARNITKKGFDSCSTQMIPKNNILMSSRAPIGLLSINKVDCCTNQGFKNIVVDNDIVDVEYLYYYLKMHIKDIEKLSGGTTFKEISKTSLENYELEIPNYNIQKQVVNILTKVDDKIILNNRMNEKLEAMAKRLYDYWFVQFDFPNEDGKPYKSSGGKMVYNEQLKRDIPEGWEDCLLKDLCDVVNGSTPSTSNPDYYGGDIIWITPKDLSDQKCKFINKGERNITKLGYDSCSTTLVPKDSIVMTSRAPIGLISIAKCDLCTNQGFKNMVPKNKNLTNYLFYLVNSLVPQFKKIGSGTTFKEIAKGELESVKVFYIPDNILSEFNKIVATYFECQYVYSEQNKKLNKLRQTLLPLLMNGQVVVEHSK